MRVAHVLLLCAAVAVSALPSACAGGFSDSHYGALFAAWRAEYGKSYPTQEEHTFRFAVFRNNIDLIAEHNADSTHTWTMGLNEFGDLLHSEFRARYVGGGQPVVSPAPTDAAPATTADALPTEVDWYAQGAVTPVGNQGQCGACYAFASSGAVESAAQISSGVLYELSKQQIVDCSGPEGNMGCEGGSIIPAFQYISAAGGLCSAAMYPYTATNGVCEASNCTKMVSIAGHKLVEANNEQALMAALVQQPVAVAIEADKPGFQFYSSGVFTGSCGTTVDHGVLVIGYSFGPSDYWLVKNSWGTSWGMGGYIQLARGPQYGPAGQCGILTSPSFPVM